MLIGLFTIQAVEQLQQLWRQMATTVGGRTLLSGNELSLPKDAKFRWPAANDPSIDSSVDGVQSPVDLAYDNFLLLVSTEFSACLGIQYVGEKHRLNLTFQPSVIKQFLAGLAHTLPVNHPWIYNISDWQSKLQPNSDHWQSHFTLQLIQIMSSLETAVVHNPLQMALSQQNSEEKLLYEVVTQIRQSLDLGEILKTSINKVQSYLQVDRLVIYQFNAKTSNADSILERSGNVVCEALLDDSIPSALHFRESPGCFSDMQQWNKYESGHIQSITDVKEKYRDHLCFAEQMDRLETRSKLVVPIVVRGKLWGLLIANDCHHPYQWQDWQQNLLQKVAEHLEIAIYQAEIHAQLQQQKNILEQQVNRQVRELRDALVASQAASEAKTEFLAVLSHELRTPLTSILGLSYTLLNLLNTNLDARQKSYLQTIKHSGDHLLELIEDMLEVSKLEAGRAVLKVSEFSVLKALQQSMQILQPRADQQKLTLQLQIMEGEKDISQDPSQDIRFRGDLKRIKQILINLLTNAIKFTEESGEVVLRAWREFDYLVLQVEDNGIGIEQDRIPLIFQKFQQLDSTLDREYEGMGLGLALTKQIVELHGGWVEVESEPGDGSTFTVWLAAQTLKPAKNKIQEAAKAIEARDDQDKQPNKTIMVVEDNQAASSLISDLLTASSYQVVSITETSVAHKQIELWQPDLVIIDQQIGEEHTNQILRYLHNLRQSQHIRYLLIATSGQLSSKEQVMEVDRLLWDRIQPEPLLTKIARVLS
jgi:two-component system, sensor histidine kinase and response regulator